MLRTAFLAFDWGLVDGRVDHFSDTCPDPVAAVPVGMPCAGVVRIWRLERATWKRLFRADRASGPAGAGTARRSRLYTKASPRYYRAREAGVDGAPRRESKWQRPAHLLYARFGRTFRENRGVRVPGRLGRPPLQRGEGALLPSGQANKARLWSGADWILKHLRCRVSGVPSVFVREGFIDAQHFSTAAPETGCGLRVSGL